MDSLYSGLTFFGGPIGEAFVEIGIFALFILLILPLSLYALVAYIVLPLIRRNKGDQTAKVPNRVVLIIVYVIVESLAPFLLLFFLLYT